MELPIIEIKNFKKYYGELKAVDIEYLSVNKGEILALLGPNGAGKTSTLETLEGLRKPDSGTLTIKGIDVQKDYNQIRKIIGVQLQAQSLPSNIKVKEAMDLFCSYYHVKPRYDLLERFDLQKKENHQFGKLSIGQQRKLALAIAIAHEPEVLILDEPTAGLDVISKAELHNILKELRDQNTAIILSSHDMFEIDKLADRIAIINKGQIIKIGSPNEIKNTYDISKIIIKTKKNDLKSFNNKYMVSKKDLDDFCEIYIKKQGIHAFLNELMKYISNQQDEIIDINIEKTSLEERFIALTNEEGK